MILIAVGIALVILLIGLLVMFAWARKIQRELVRMGAGFYAETRRDIRALKSEQALVRGKVLKIESDILRANSRITENELGSKW